MRLFPQIPSGNRLPPGIQALVFRIETQDGLLYDLNGKILKIPFFDIGLLFFNLCKKSISRKKLKMQKYGSQNQQQFDEIEGKD